MAAHRGWHLKVSQTTGKTSVPWLTIPWTWQPIFQRWHPQMFCSTQRNRTFLATKRQILSAVSIYISPRNNAHVLTFWAKAWMQSPLPIPLFGILFERDHPITLTSFEILLSSIFFHQSWLSSPPLLLIKCSKPSQHLDFRGRMAAIFTWSIINVYTQRRIRKKKKGLWAVNAQPGVVSGRCTQNVWWKL